MEKHTPRPESLTGVTSYITCTIVHAALSFISLSVNGETALLLCVIRLGWIRWPLPCALYLKSALLDLCFDDVDDRGEGNAECRHAQTHRDANDHTEAGH